MTSKLATDREQMLLRFWQNEDYRDFLLELLANGWVPQLKTNKLLASALDVSGSFITKVLAKAGHLSIDQIGLCSEALGFNETETSALIQKLLLLKSDSEKMKSVFKARIRELFDQAHTSKPPSRDKAQHITPADLLFYRVANALRGQPPATLTELAEKTRVGRVRLDHLLQQMAPHFPIHVQKVNGETRYSLASDSASFASNDGSDYETYRFHHQLRRLAAHSLDVRRPIDLVDDGDHYIATGFIGSLTEKQIMRYKSELTNLARQFVQESQTAKTAKEKLFYVGFVCDLFDAAL